MDEQQSSGWKYVGIGCGIAAILGICVVGGCVACGGAAGAGIFMAVQAPAEEAKGLLRDVRADGWDAAYARMSESWRATHTVEQLHAAVDASAALSSHTDDTIDNRSVNGSHATMRGRLHTPQGDVPVDVELSQVGDHWYVDAVIVSGVPAL